LPQEAEDRVKKEEGRKKPKKKEANISKRKINEPAKMEKSKSNKEHQEKGQDENIEN